MSMRQIARLAGVSHATVSMALRDDPRISTTTREKVKEIARRLDFAFSPTSPARSAAGKIIGLIVHENFGEKATNLLLSVMDEARNARLGLMMIQATQDPQWIEEEIYHLLDLGISGLIIAHSYSKYLPRRILMAIRSKGIHVVQAMNRVFAEPLDTICRDETSFARIAAAHFAALGHRRIFCMDFFGSKYHDIFQEFGLELLQSESSATERDMLNAFSLFIKMTPRPTAIFASLEPVAYRMFCEARWNGLNVPGDLSILCIGRSKTFPEITTIDIKTHEMGRLSSKLLFDRIAADIPPYEITDFQNIVLPADLIDRGSTGPAPS